MGKVIPCYGKRSRLPDGILERERYREEVYSFCEQSLICRAVLGHLQGLSNFIAPLLRSIYVTHIAFNMQSF